MMPPEVWPRNVYNSFKGDAYRLKIIEMMIADGLIVIEPESKASGRQAAGLVGGSYDC